MTRIYKTGADGGILPSQPSGYPFTLNRDYQLKPNETARVHKGVDLSSRPTPDAPPQPLEFRAGVHGVVVRAGEGKYGVIAIQIWDGSVLEYLHTSVSYVRKHDIVAPETPLGLTGKRGADAIHLHVQAKNASGTPLAPDLVFRIGQRKLESAITPEESWPDFDPDQAKALDAEVDEGGVVSAKTTAKQLWKSQVVGMGGTIDLTLGEFSDYLDAVACSIAWSKANPDDLRLTREIEVRRPK